MTTDKDEILSELTRLEGELANTYALFAKVRDSYTEALSENAQLIMENDKLRARLEELSSSKAVDKETTVENLRKIYADGFHVCHPFYGKKLHDGESCSFCDAVIYG